MNTKNTTTEDVIKDTDKVQETVKPLDAPESFVFNKNFIPVLKHEIGNIISFHELKPIIDLVEKESLTKAELNAVVNKLATFPYNYVEKIILNINNFILTL